MSVIIVGDINVEETKNKIVEYFGGMEMPVNAKDRQYYNIPDHEGIKVGVLKTRRWRMSSFMFILKRRISLF